MAFLAAENSPVSQRLVGLISESVYEEVERRVKEGMKAEERIRARKEGLEKEKREREKGEEKVEPSGVDDVQPKILEL